MRTGRGPVPPEQFHHLFFFLMDSGRLLLQPPRAFPGLKRLLDALSPRMEWTPTRLRVLRKGLEVMEGLSPGQVRWGEDMLAEAEAQEQGARQALSAAQQAGVEQAGEQQA